MKNPIVTIICLCYDQKRFVAEALQSVMNQSYASIQLIVVDDGSTDGTVDVIRHFLRNHPHVQFLPLPENLGMTRAFNTGLRLATGEFIVDLAGDDILMPKRIEKQVAAFRQLDASYGVVFSDAYLVDEQSQRFGTFYRRHSDGTLAQSVASGDIYTNLLRQYCVCAPTIMSRKAVYDQLGGYDETLSYEDFDFFIRSARQYKYFYQDELLTCYRKSPGSDSTQWYKRRHNPQLISTLTVCRKAYHQNRTSEEHQALAYRVRYHQRHSFFTENFTLAEEYTTLLAQLGGLDLPARIIQWLSRFRLPVGFLYRWYRYLRFVS